MTLLVKDGKFTLVSILGGKMTHREMKEFMLSITREAGILTQSMFGKFGKVETKSGPLDVVTEADKASDQLFTDRITASLPDHGIISEELPAYQTDKDYVWVIDPIDGTLNYRTGIPSYAIIVALRYKNETIMSCVHNPVTGEFHTAEKGRGAYLNGGPIHCSNHETIESSLGLTNDAVSVLRKDMFSRALVSFKEKSFWASSIGCTGVSCGLLADGRKHWYLCSGGGGIWDYAGTVLLLQESGCLVTDLEGKEWEYGTGPFIAANPILHRQLIKLFTQDRVVQFSQSR